MSAVNLALGAIAAAATVMATYLAWRQQRVPRHGEAIKVGEKITVYLSRKGTVVALAEMLRRAGAGKSVFGQCRTCSDYPDEFYQALMEAAGRGVMFRFIVSPASEGKEFAKRVQGLRTMKLKFRAIEHSRVFGVVGEEAIYVVSAPNAYIGVHVRDPVAASHQQAAFEAEWDG